MSTEIITRGVAEDDIPELTHLLKEFATFERAEATVTPDVLHDSLFGPERFFYVFVAVSSGHIVGMVMYYKTFSSWTGRPGIFIEALYVTPAYRGCGIGKRLIQQLAIFCKENNFARIDWWVLDWNKRAIEFHSSLGSTLVSGWLIHRFADADIHRLASAL